MPGRSGPASGSPPRWRSCSRPPPRDARGRRRARRGGDRQVGAAGARDRPRISAADASSRWRRVRDRFRLRGAAAAVRSGARPYGGTALPAAHGARVGVRAPRRAGAGSLPRRAGDAGIAGGGRPDPARRLRDRRCALDRRGVAAGARVRRPAHRGRARRGGVRRAGSGRVPRAVRVHAPEDHRAGRDGRAGAAGVGGSRPVGRRRARRVIAEAQGNPLALLKLPRTVDPLELAGGFSGLSGRPVPSVVEKEFGDRLAAVPEDTRTLLQLAAADPLGDPTLLRRAADALGLSVDAGESAGPPGC